MSDARRASSGGAPLKGSELPTDFTEMVKEVFTAHFDEALQKFAAAAGVPYGFEASGMIYPNEILLRVTLKNPEELAATTLYGSVDFDPQASAPSAQDLLSCCVDGVASLFDWLVQGEGADERIEAMVSASLSALDGIPWEWSSIEVQGRPVFVRIDKANPKLDAMADEWLAQHDPEQKHAAEEEAEKTADRFVGGPSVESLKKRKTPGDGSGSSSLH